MNMVMTNIVTSKIVGCVTDNGSNFLMAFREFGIESADASQQAGDGDSTNEPDGSVDAIMNCPLLMFMMYLIQTAVAVT